MCNILQQNWFGPALSEAVHELPVYIPILQFFDTPTDV
jgi:hypothetical protein